MTLIRLQMYAQFSNQPNFWTKKSKIPPKIFFFAHNFVSLQRKTLLQMSSKTNPLATMVNNYLMKMAVPLAAWFIVEYLIRNAMYSHIMLSFLIFPMMLVTPVALWWLIRKLRRDFLGDAILGIQAWSFGVQLMFYASLIEALFIYVFNQFVRPGNLHRIQQAAIEQYENVRQTLAASGSFERYMPRLQQAIDALKEAPVLSPIETAISTLSNNLFIAIALMIPIALIVRRHPQLPQQ